MGDIDLRAVRDFLKKREDKNGNPRIVAIRSQHLKDYLILSLHKNSYHEYLEQICVSLARLSCGDIYNRDHWEQIVESALIAISDLIEMENMSKSNDDRDQ
jgi:hypothetical protein